MTEKGVDISHHKSQRVDDFLDEHWDYEVTVCGHARETCPMFQGRAKIIHVGSDDLPALATVEPTEEGAMTHYCRVRDEIREFVESLPGSLQK